MNDITMASGLKAPPRSKKSIRSWMLFDWAAQPFHTLILTFIFAPYFTSSVVGDPIKGQELWGYALGIGGLLIAVLSPVFGAIADTTGPRKPWIVVFTFMAVIGASSLWYATPNGSDTVIYYAIASFILCMIGFEFAAVFNNAMMPDLVPREQLGRLSGSSWGLGYLGGLITLIMVLLLLSANPQTGLTLAGIPPIFGFDVSMREGDRAAGPLTAIWMIIFIIPFFLFTPDSPKRERVTGAIKKGLSDLVQTLKNLHKTPSLFSYLISSMIYRDGLNALYAFGGIYAAGVLNWTIIEIGTFGILANITGALGAWFGGRMDDRSGPKLVISISIIALIIACLSIVSTSPREVFFLPVADGSSLPDMMFYVFGAVIGASGGALQASSRTLLVDQADENNMTEAFGLYALSGRATSFIGPLAIGWATAAFASQRIGVLPVVLLLLGGLLILPFVKQRMKSS